jgi:predicted ATP-grasp superfamily ATP-dependent carboligase
MEKELRKTPRKASLTHESDKGTQLYENALKSRPGKIDPQALQTLSKRLEQIATTLGVSVDDLLEKAERSAEFKEEYLEARSLSCQIAILKK